MKLAFATRAHKRAVKKLTKHLVSVGSLAEAGLEQAAPLYAHENGLPIRDLSNIIENIDDVLGEGGFGRVAAVDPPACEPLCVKTIKSFHGDLVDETLREAQHMLALKDVDGLPRVLGVSKSPLAILMTRHG